MDLKIALKNLRVNTFNNNNNYHLRSTSFILQKSKPRASERLSNLPEVTQLVNLEFMSYLPLMPVFSLLHCLTSKRNGPII